MGQSEESPHFSIIFHDDRSPTGRVLTRIRGALEKAFDLRCIGVCRSLDDSVEEIAVHYRFADLPGVPREARVTTNASLRKQAHCDLLDDLDVPNGVKAIAIALHAHWSDQHSALYGDAANPSTVKRWRSERKSLRTPASPGLVPNSRRSASARRVVWGLRRHHAIRVNACGARIQDGYDRAIADLRVVNAGGHRFYGKPEAPLPFFSYATFRRDCLSIKHGRGDRVTRRRR